MFEVCHVVCVLAVRQLEVFVNVWGCSWYCCL